MDAQELKPGSSRWRAAARRSPRRRMARRRARHRVVAGLRPVVAERRSRRCLLTSRCSPPWWCSPRSSRCPHWRPPAGGAPCAKPATSRVRWARCAWRFARVGRACRWTRRCASVRSACMRPSSSRCCWRTNCRAPAPELLADTAQRLALRLKRRVAFERKMLARTASGRRRGAVAASIPPLALLALHAGGIQVPLAALLFVVALEACGCWLLWRVARVEI